MMKENSKKVLNYLLSEVEVDGEIITIDEQIVFLQVVGKIMNGETSEIDKLPLISL